MRIKRIYIFFISLILFLLLFQVKYFQMKPITHNLILAGELNEGYKSSIVRNSQKININLNNKKHSLDLEDYVYGVLSCEMPALFEEEALKAGAIAARTYAMEKVKRDENHVFLGTAADQCFNTESELKEKWNGGYSTYSSKLKRIVSDTSGLVMKHKGKIIKSFYFSLSNGKTENVETVFYEHLDYLRSVDSSMDKNISGFSKTISMSKRDFLEGLNLKYSDKIILSNIKKTEGNRVKEIYINGVKFNGEKVRRSLGLRSSDFDIVVNNMVNITTRGFGHGVGMSQYGANELAKKGYTYDEILNHYYQNIIIDYI